jgi:hypothetical protein
MISEPMPSSAFSRNSRRRRLRSECIDPVVGNILAGWRFDISGLSPAMRGDYDQHFDDCASCRRRQRVARTIDLLLISVSTLSLVAFLLAAVVIHRVEMITHLGSIHLELHHTAIAISLEAVAIAGMVISALLWLLIAIATPLPGLVGSFVERRLPAEVRERSSKNAA